MTKKMLQFVDVKQETPEKRNTDKDEFFPILNLLGKIKNTKIIILTDELKNLSQKKEYKTFFCYYRVILVTFPQTLELVQLPTL